jgi:succinoglycan biosynthesis protein ExoA
MADQTLPFITIIIPVGPNRSCKTVLDSIRNLDYPKEKMEVIIAEGRQPARQRNEAIKIAKGSLLYFFDDDVILKPDIIKRMLGFYKNPEITMVGGPNLTPETDSFLQKCFGYSMSSFFATAQMSSRYKSAGHEREATEKNLICCNVSGQAMVLRNNLFNETLWPCEENELLNRLHSKGYKFIFDPQSIVYHSRRSSLGKFIKQNFGYGRGRVEQLLIQPSTFEFIFLTPPLFVFYLMSLGIGFVSRAFPMSFLLPFSIPFFAYCTINIFVSLWTACAAKKAMAFPLLPSIFFLIHIPYGLGMIYGFFHHFFNHKKPCLDVKLRWIDITKAD